MGQRVLLLGVADGGGGGGLLLPASKTALTIAIGTTPPSISTPCAGPEGIFRAIAEQEAVEDVDV